MKSAEPEIKEAAAKGRGGDTVMAHLTRGEITIPPELYDTLSPDIKHALNSAFEVNGSHIDRFTAGSKESSKNPETGAYEYSWWTDIRNAVEDVGVVAGNYVLPGSSMLTSQLASKGSQADLGSTLGQVAQVGSSLYGGLTGATQAPAPVTDATMTPVGGDTSGMAGTPGGAGPEATGTSALDTGVSAPIDPATGLPSTAPAAGLPGVSGPSALSAPSFGAAPSATAGLGGQGVSLGGAGTEMTGAAAPYEAAVTPTTPDATTTDTTGAAAAPGAPATPDTMQKALSALKSYGPLGLTAANLLANKGAQSKFADQLRGVGAPQTAAATQMLSDAQAGKINPADAYNIKQWQDTAKAQAKQYYASAGLSDSSMANNAMADIDARANAMVEQSLQNQLTLALGQLNISDQNQVNAIKAEMSANAAAGTQGTAFLQALAQYSAGPASKAAT